jgi:AraC-like DNA-binding protein
VIYREYAPPSAVAQLLICSWTLHVGRDRPVHQQRVLPDGCSDIVWIGDARPIAVGPMTRPVLETITPGTTLVGLRFRPEAASRVLGLPANELTDRDVPLSELWRSALVDDTSDRMRAERSTARRVAIAQSMLASHLDAIRHPDPIAHHAVSQLTSGRAQRIDDLAKDIGISERQLHRRFVASVGYSPKTFQRIVRFQKLLALTDAGARSPLGDVSIAAGYADQAHMTREVVEFAGVTPGALLGTVASALVGSSQTDRNAR